LKYAPKRFKILAKNLEENLPVSTLCLCMVSSSCIIYAFSEILLTERNLVEGQKLQQKEREKRKRESDKKTRKNEKPKVVGWFVIQTLTGAHAQAKKLLNMILVKNMLIFCVSRAVLSDLELF